VLSELAAQGATPEDLARINTPAGVDLGPSSQEEIGLAVLAAVVAHKNRLQEEPATTICAPTEAIDPVCGMSVPITETAVMAEVAGATHYFCSPACRDSFLIRERRPS
jgi:xanthine dehydrogenase accessory factor